MGRQRTPDYLKLVSGTYRQDRANLAAPKGDLVLLQPPSWLNTEAAAIFNATAIVLFELGVSQAGDETMLALLASRLDEVRTCSAIIEDLGPTYASNHSSRDKLMKRRPEVGQRAEAMRHAQSLLNEFGLSPASRSKVTAIAAHKGRNPFEALA